MLKSGIEKEPPPALAPARTFDRLLAPGSVAVIGGDKAAAVIEQCLAIGFKGEIWPIHPTKKKVHGLRAYRSVSELPRAPDAAFIAVNRSKTIEVVNALRQCGAGGAICYASGFSEADDVGEKLQQALIEAAGDMPVIGPNCYGILNYADGVALWPDQHGGKKLDKGKTGVAIIAQSSNIAVNITMQRRGLPISYVLTVGNQAQTGLSQMALNLLNNPRVSALGLHIEGFDSIAGMQEVAKRARFLKKPIVAMKMGRSQEAQQAAFTHTASLAGSDAAATTFLNRIAIARVYSIPSLLETLKLLHVHGPLSGGDISAMSCSGGEASLMADAAHGRMIRFPSLTPDQMKPISQALGPLVSVANPLDYHTYVWGNRKNMEAAYTAMLAAGFDINCLILDYPRSDRCSAEEWTIPTEALIAASGSTGAKAAIISTLHENLSERRAASLIDHGIAPMLGIDETLDAIEAAAAIGKAWSGPEPAEIEEPASRVAAKEYIPDEAEAKKILSDFGFTIPRGKKISRGDKLTGLNKIGKNIGDTIAAQAEKIGFPVALKALGIAHKSEMNAVRLNLQNGNDVQLAANDLLKISGELYVEEFVTDKIFELLLGLSFDPQFGMVMTIATGGTMVEVLDDCQTLLLPTSRFMVEKALGHLKSRVFFEGFRGGPKADFAQTVNAILLVQKFALENCGRLIELDINPLIVRPVGQGVIAADALIKFRRQD